MSEDDFFSAMASSSLLGSETSPPPTSPSKKGDRKPKPLDWILPLRRRQVLLPKFLRLKRLGPSFERHVTAAPEKEHLPERLRILQRNKDSYPGSEVFCDLLEISPRQRRLVRRAEDLRPQFLEALWSDDAAMLSLHGHPEFIELLFNRYKLQTQKEKLSFILPEDLLKKTAVPLLFYWGRGGLSNWCGFSLYQAHTLVMLAAVLQLLVSLCWLCSPVLAGLTAFKLLAGLLLRRGGGTRGRLRRAACLLSDAASAAEGLGFVVYFYIACCYYRWQPFVRGLEILFYLVFWAASAGAWSSYAAVRNAGGNGQEHLCPRGVKSLAAAGEQAELLAVPVVDGDARSWLSAVASGRQRD